MSLVLWPPKQNSRHYCMTGAFQVALVLLLPYNFFSQLTVYLPNFGHLRKLSVDYMFDIHLAPGQFILAHNLP